MTGKIMLEWVKWNYKIQYQILIAIKVTFKNANINDNPN